MTYETEGYVNAIKISANSLDENLFDFVPTSAYMLEENGQTYCMFKAVTSDGQEECYVVEAKLLRLDKAKAVSMQIKTEALRTALIMAKVNHSKVRIEIDGSFFKNILDVQNQEDMSQDASTEHSSQKVLDGRKSIIMAVEFV